MNPENSKGQYPPSSEYRKSAYFKSFDEYKKVYDESVKDPVAYWVKQADNIDWYSKGWKDAFTWDKTENKFTWFKGGKLNVSYNCLDRHVNAGKKNTAALIFQGEDDSDVKIYTYGGLLRQVKKFANVLKSKGVKKGDRVAIYLPMIPELPISVLACARIGAIHSVMFAGLGTDSVYNRIMDCTPKVVITSDGSFRGGKIIDIKGKVNEVLERENPVKHVITVKRTGTNVAMKYGRDVWWHEEMAEASTVCEPEVMDAEDPLFLLYTSGTTGKPKGLVHTNGGYIVGAYTSFRNVFNYNPGQIYWCTADIGWITGHSYIVYGPLSFGATALMFEGVPNFPDNDRYWQVVEKWEVDIFYTAPTSIRMIRKTGDEHILKHDLTSLKMLGSVGEPIDADVWKWYHRLIGGGRCPIADTWWQTETGSILISPMTGAMDLKPGSAMRPLPGVEPSIYTEEKKPCGPGESGNLYIDKPVPSLARTIWNDHNKYVETYWAAFPGHYLTGDGARKDNDGDIWLLGRVDDVIGVAGHRIGAAEVEAAMITHPAVAEAAAVPVPDDIKGEAIYVYATLKDGYKDSDALKREMINQVRHSMGPWATPKTIQIVSGLPKTRSGKIMRRICRKIAWGSGREELGDVTTLTDPAVVDEMIKGRIT
ncbi:acetyl-coenzyme A synthetase [Candidatus Methanoplasma termitum]|uniref:Acetate--CoA ligase n=1 Tax=Candidatus Methanoplasma termitum TaxID=1577791 RepID=A0A0A7LF58_9ARCH|nr:acetate--CoA ligase [Candidatus Methanoplasma termitum]AIZ56116.1 acetyl-coenzyme A synthetase [Candidatus Methanoplasma termitum]MCL2333955.1 acetate--CoA ligase [Candidatus Methanoplasma sp.]